MIKAGRLGSIFWRGLKYLGIVFAVILLLFGLVSWVVVAKKNDWLLAEIEKFMNESQSGQLKITSTNFRLFKNFPDVSIELDSIRYYEHRDSLLTPGEKPILLAEQLFVAIELLPLMNNELKISEISISNAQVNIVQYKNGKLNLELAMADPRKAKSNVASKKNTKPPVSTKPREEKKPNPVTPPQPKTAIQINLEFVSMNDITMTWNSNSNTKPSVIYFHQVEVDLFRNKKVLEASLSSACEVRTLYLNQISVPEGDLTIHTNLVYEPERKQLTIQKSKIKYNEFSATIQGNYTHQKNQPLNLEVDASSNDLELLSIFIKPEILKRNPDLLKDVDVYAEGRVFGELKNRAPQFDFSFGIKNLDLHLPNQLGMFQRIGFDGHFISGNSADYSQAVFKVNNLRGKLPGGFLKGEFNLTNFVDPYLQYDLAAQLKVDGYDQVFNINAIKQLTGSVSFQANFDGPLKYFKQHQMDSSRSSSMALKDLSFILTKTNLQVSGLSGKIVNRNNQATLEQFRFIYGKNDVLINATVDNLVHYIFKRETDLAASGNLQSKQLFTHDFLFDSTRTAQIEDRISNLSFNFQVNTSPNKVDTSRRDILFDIKNLTAKLDKLPDIKSMNTKGALTRTSSGLKLALHKFNVVMPQGKLDVTGDLLIREKRLWEFNARVDANKFPWIYIRELVAEIRSDEEPTAKNIPVKEMDLITASLDISSSIITYPFDFNKLEIRNSKLHWLMTDSKIFSVDKFDVALQNLHFIHPENSGSLTGLQSTKGSVVLKQLQVPGLNKVDVNMKVMGKNDSLDIVFSSATQLAASEAGNLFLDISKKERALHLQYTVMGASLEYFMEKFYKKKFMNGDIDYTLDLHSTGTNWTALKQNLAGEITITGDSIHLSGVDIDKVLRKFERSQNFNLTDVGAVLIAGPIGLAVTKGTDFVSLATVNLNPNDHTFIRALHTQWKLENRQLITEDVAFSTLQNRLAFNGRIDFARDSIPGLTIAVVDKNGCSLMDQNLYGKMNALKTGKLNITKTLFGSVINFVNVVVGKDCKPVYTGKVKAP